jgi:hypothetical protein
MIVKDQLQSLNHRGFFIADHFLDAQTVQSLIYAIRSLDTDTDTDTDTEASRLRNGIPFARRNLMEFNFVRELFERPAIRDLLDSITPSLVPVRAILFDKITSANWTVPWHQDRSIAVRKRIDVPGFLARGLSKPASCTCNRRWKFFNRWSRSVSISIPAPRPTARSA